MGIGNAVALIECPDCRNSVSDRAAACPQCGHPIAADADYGPSGDLRALTEKPSPKRSGCAGVMVFGLIGVAMLIAIGTNSGGSKPTTPQQATCTSNWHLCSDNADIANHYSDYSHAKSSCQIEAEKLAKYGSPKWPWVAFGRFYNDGSAVKNGTITLIENDAQFQNGFGAMAHSSVTCTYNLNTKVVTNVVIAPH
jgi:hypothetical protein